MKGRPKGQFSSNDNTLGTVGSLIGTSRAEVGLGLKDVAEQLGVSVAFVSNIEHGRAPLPFKYISQLAYILNIDEDILAHHALSGTHLMKKYLKLTNIGDL